MSIYRFDESVASDLEAIWDSIAVDDIDAADRWIERCFRRSNPWLEIREWGIRDEI